MLDFGNVCVTDNLASAFFSVNEIIKTLKLLTGDLVYTEVHKILFEDRRCVTQKKTGFKF